MVVDRRAATWLGLKPRRGRGSTFAFGLILPGVHVARARTVTTSYSDRHGKRRLTTDREPDEAHRDRGLLQR